MVRAGRPGAGCAENRPSTHGSKRFLRCVASNSVLRFFVVAECPKHSIYAFTSARLNCPQAPMTSWPREMRM